MAEKENGRTSSDFSITRTFDAPRELMFKMWTDPNHIKKWLAPGGMVTHYRKADIKPGGVAHFYMETPGGKMWGKALYREITPVSRLVYIQSFSDESEGVSSHPMIPSWPREMLTTVTFEALGNTTKVTLTWTVVNATAEEMATFEKSKNGMNQGWGGSFDQLDAYLKNPPFKLNNRGEVELP